MLLSHLRPNVLVSTELANVTLWLLVKIKAGKNSKQSQRFFSWTSKLPSLNWRVWFGSDSNHVPCFASYFQFWTQFEFVRGFPLLTNEQISTHAANLGTQSDFKVPYTDCQLGYAEARRKPSTSYVQTTPTALHLTNQASQEPTPFITPVTGGALYIKRTSTQKMEPTGFRNVGLYTQHPRVITQKDQN